MIGKAVTVTVDRPKGSVHPVYKNLVYPLNYGFVEGVIAPDGEWQDVYVMGVDVPLKQFAGRVIAVIKRLDDVEEKWVAAPPGVTFSKQEIERQTHFQEQYFRCEIICENDANADHRGVDTGCGADKNVL